MAAAVSPPLHNPYAADAPGAKVLRYTMYESAIGTTEDGTLDPLRTFQMLYVTLQHQIFETLVAIDFNTQRIIPVLAERWEQKDPRTIRFYLRRGVRFHNAEQFNAAAVRFTLDLMRDPRNKFGGRFLLDAIAAVTVIDDYTVEIVLSSPDALLLRKLAAVGFIFPPKYYSTVGDAYFTRHPMGTGPFRFFYNKKRPDGIKEIHLTANEDYWGKRPAADELVYDFIPQTGQLQAVQTGMVDMLITQDLSQKDELSKSPRLSVYTQPSLRSAVCLLNIDKPGPLQDIRVRKALQHAVRRRDLIARSLQGSGKPLFTVAPEGSIAYASSTPLYDENGAKARDLLSSAGYGDGVFLSVMAADNRPTAAVAEALKDQLAEAGIMLAISYLNREAIKKEVVEPKLRGDTRPSTFDVWIINGWPDLFGATAHFYFLFLHSQGIFNFGISLKKKSVFDTYYADALRASDANVLAKRLKRLDRLILQEAVALPLYQVELLYAMDRHINFRPGLNDLPLRFKECVFE